MCQSNDKEPCEVCGTTNDVEYCINPYYQDMDGEEIWQWLCDDCYNTFVMDI